MELICSCRHCSTSRRRLPLHSLLLPVMHIILLQWHDMANTNTGCVQFQFCTYVRTYTAIANRGEFHFQNHIEITLYYLFAQPSNFSACVGIVATKGNTEHKIQDTTHWMIHHKPTPWEVLSLWRRVRLLSVVRPRIRRRRRLARNYLLIDVIAMFCIILRVWFVRRVVCPPSKGIFDRQSLAVAI